MRSDQIKSPSRRSDDLLAVGGDLYGYRNSYMDTVTNGERNRNRINRFVRDSGPYPHPDSGISVPCCLLSNLTSEDFYDREGEHRVTVLSGLFALVKGIAQASIHLIGVWYPQDA
jgi:hypothetical protein